MEEWTQLFLFLMKKFKPIKDVFIFIVCIYFSPQNIV